MTTDPFLPYERTPAMETDRSFVDAIKQAFPSHAPANYSVGRMTYDLRRLRLHGLIQRIPKSHRYDVTPGGLRIALFFSRTYARLLRPKLAQIMPAGPPGDSPLRAAFDRLQTEIDRCCEEEKLVA